MNTSFLDNIVWIDEFILNTETSSSFYASEVSDALNVQGRGEQKQAIKDLLRANREAGRELLLPYRIGVIPTINAPKINDSGRGNVFSIGQLKGKFTEIQNSPYKVYPPYEIHTSLWKVEDKPLLYYGTIGITGSRGKIAQDNGDLLIVRTSDWKALNIFIFKGLAGRSQQLSHLTEATEYVENHLIR
jgi:hypothetical protein